jgi:hypothetical protein
VSRGIFAKALNREWLNCCGATVATIQHGNESTTAATTRSTPMPFMQRKSIGHSRKKHGEHGASDFSN